MDRQRVTTILTLIFVSLWMVTAVVRISVPWPEARVLDSVIPVIVGYWFLSSGRKNGSTT